MNDMKKCPVCGREVKKNLSFCTYCGNKFVETNIESPSNNKMLKTIIIVLIVVIALLIGFVLFGGKTNNTSSGNNTESNSSENLIEDNSDYNNDEDYYSDNETIACSDIKNYKDSTYVPADGEIFYFGSYEQDGDCTNGTEPIEWITLNIETGEHAGETLLVSKYVLDVQPYDSNGDTKWSNSSLRKWLNDQFYNEAFSSEEKTKILNASNYNDSINVKLANGGSINTIADITTTEKVVIFRTSAIDTYVSQGLMSREAKGTPYAWQQFYGDSESYEYKNMSYSIRGMLEEGPYVNTNGQYEASDYCDSTLGVRPCIFIN